MYTHPLTRTLLQHVHAYTHSTQGPGRRDVKKHRQVAHTTCPQELVSMYSTLNSSLGSVDASCTVMGAGIQRGTGAVVSLPLTTALWETKQQPDLNVTKL